MANNKKTITDRNLKILVDLEKQYGSLEKIHPKVKEVALGFVYNATDKLLPLCFSLHQKRTESSDELKKDVEKVDFLERLVVFLDNLKNVASTSLANRLKQLRPTGAGD